MTDTFRKVIIQQQYNHHAQKAIILWSDPVTGGGNRHCVVLSKTEQDDWYTTCNLYDENIVKELVPASLDETIEARRLADNYIQNGVAR